MILSEVRGMVAGRNEASSQYVLYSNEWIRNIIIHSKYISASDWLKFPGQFFITSHDQIWKTFADINAIDVNCTDIDRKRDSKRRRIWENGAWFHRFCEEEIAELLPRDIERIAKILLKRRQLPLFYPQINCQPSPKWWRYNPPPPPITANVIKNHDTVLFKNLKWGNRKWCNNIIPYVFFWIWKWTILLVKRATNEHF